MDDCLAIGLTYCRCSVNKVAPGQNFAFAKFLAADSPVEPKNKPIADIIGVIGGAVTFGKALLAQFDDKFIIAYFGLHWDIEKRDAERIVKWAREIVNVAYKRVKM